MNRREFIGVLGGAAGALALPGCLCPPPCRPGARLAFLLGALHDYIAGKTGPDGVHTSGAGLAKAFRALKAMGYEGVEFDDNYLNDAKTLKAMLADSGLVACGRWVDKQMLAPERIAETCEFEINYGNNLLVCAEGNAPAEGENAETFLKNLVAFYNTAAVGAAKCGCRVAMRVGASAFVPKLADGQPFVEAFLERADTSVCIELDAAACADPCGFLGKHSHRSPTLLVRVDENAEWDAVRSVAARDGVAWYVASSAPCGDLSAALSASRYFQARGIG